MSDLLSILPSFPLTSFTHNIVSSLENHSITTSDLLTLDIVDVSRRTAISLLDVRRFSNEVMQALHRDLEGTNEDLGSTTEDGQQPVRKIGESGFEVWRGQRLLSTTDRAIDQILGGGLMTGCITEFVGESGCGKTQILLQLCVAAQLPVSLGGLGRSAVYISTEASLPTTRLLQLLSSFKARFRDNLGSLDDLSTDNVLCITCGDLESQEHILNYQLPVVVEKHNVGLIVMDSVAANFRAEYEGRPKTKLEDPTGKNSGPAILAKRGKQLIKLGQTLRNLARDYKIVVAVANQVSDRFQTGPDSNNIDVMALDHQARWFTGWGEDEDMWDDLGTKKTPALGLVWANCIGARIALLKGYHRTKLGSNTEEGGADAGWRRGMKVVYAPWAEGSRYCEYVIDGDGVKGVEE